MGNKLSNLGHYRTLSPGLGPELPITAEVSRLEEGDRLWILLINGHIPGDITGNRRQ